MTPELVIAAALAGILACFIGYNVVQWICKVMDRCKDNENADKKTKREIDEANE